MSLYLAIDAGGTKTDYLLADEGRSLARVRGGCIKRMRVDESTATANLADALDALQQESGQALTGVTRTCVGTAGETVPLVTEFLRTALGARVGGELVLVGDVEIALDAAFQGGSGVLVLAGTGSNVAGRRSDGTLLNAGGWGPLMADQGSANRLGLSGLRAGFLARDEGRATPLLRQAARFWNLPSEGDLVAFANSVPAPDFSQLSETVHRCAREGDAVAREVLAAEGRELGYLVRLVVRGIVQGLPQGRTQDHEAHSVQARHSAPAGDAAELPDIAFAGSVMQNVPAVREALLLEVRREFPGVRERDGVVDPIAGALWRARTRSAGGV